MSQSSLEYPSLERLINNPERDDITFTCDDRTLERVCSYRSKIAQEGPQKNTYFYVILGAFLLNNGNVGILPDQDDPRFQERCDNLATAIEAIPNFWRRVEDYNQEAFIRLLLNIKQPKCFAESVLNGRHRYASRYSKQDLEILSGMGMVMLSYALNDGGHHQSFKNHDNPHPMLVGLISSPLFLDNGTSPEDARLSECHNGQCRISQEVYDQEIERRLLPVLLQMNAEAEKFGKRLHLTIPGLGTGQFAGFFFGKPIQEALNQAIQNLLMRHAENLPFISEVLLDVYAFGDNGQQNKSTNSISHIAYTFAASSTDLQIRKQLAPSKPQDNDVLDATIIAGDLISYIGNDFWVNSRSTDEGVKGASTSVMVQIACQLNTYLKSYHFTYDHSHGRYWPNEQARQLIAPNLDSAQFAWHILGQYLHASPYSSYGALGHIEVYRHDPHPVVEENEEEDVERGAYLHAPNPVVEENEEDHDDVDQKRKLSQSDDDESASHDENVQTISAENFKAIISRYQTQHWFKYLLNSIFGYFITIPKSTVMIALEALAEEKKPCISKADIERCIQKEPKHAQYRLGLFDKQSNPACLPEVLNTNGVIQALSQQF